MIRVKKESKLILERKIESKNLLPVMGLLFIVFLTFYLYSFSFSAGFVWDDYSLICNNLYIQSFSHIKDIFTTDWGSGSGLQTSFYRPLAIVSYIFDYKLWGLHAGGYHLVNTLLHIVAVLLVFWVAKQIAGTAAAFAGALLFAVFPGNVQTVCYLSNRAEIFSAIFLLLSLGFYILFYEKERKAYFVLSAFFIFLGFLAKESILVFFAVALCYHFCYLRKIKLLPSLLLLMIVFLYMAVHAMIFHSQVLPFSVLPQYEVPLRLMLSPASFLGYLKMIFWPLGLHAEYMDYPHGWDDWRVGCGVFLLALLVTVIFLIRRRNKTVAFTLSWFVVALLPYTGLYPLAFYKSDHYIYFPVIGFFIACGILFAWLYERYRRLAFSILAMVVIFYSVLTIRQNSYWLDAVKFYKTTLQYSPYSKRLRIMLGREYLNRNQFDLSVKAFEGLINIFPDSFDGYYELGFAYAINGQRAPAVALLEKALQFHDGECSSYLNVGCLFQSWGYRKDAEQSFREALRIKPDNPTAKLKLSALGDLNPINPGKVIK